VSQSGEASTSVAASLPSLPTALRTTAEPVARRADVAEAVVGTNGMPIADGNRPDIPDTKHKGTADQRRSR
jgi:hypothetical protein